MDGFFLLMVGVGSGKMCVLIYRIVYLMVEKYVVLWNILVIIFINKVVCEMKECVESIFGLGVDDIWIFIFYSMCVWILCRDIDWIGINCNFFIFDMVDQFLVIKGILKECNFDLKKFDLRSIFGMISSVKNELIELEEFFKVVGGYYDQVVSDVYIDYQKKLLKN